MDIDVNQLANSLNNRADRDLNNLSQSGKENITGWCTPSNRYIDLELGETGKHYVAPANGTVYFKRTNNGTAGVTNTILNERTGMFAESFSPYTVAVNLNVLKGDGFTIYHTGSAINIVLRFYYAEGAN